MSYHKPARVSLEVTEVKYYCANTDQTITETLIGRYTVPECRNLVQMSCADLNLLSNPDKARNAAKNNVYIDKLTFRKNYDVPAWPLINALTLLEDIQELYNTDVDDAFKLLELLQEVVQMQTDKVPYPERVAFWNVGLAQIKKKV